MIALWAALAFARPDDPSDLYAFDATDVLASHDEGGVRVWYSTLGPNRALPADADEDDVPDLVASVAATAVDVLAFWAAEGLRAPLSDGTEGGSAALDVYLVDFAGSADGWFSSEGCDDTPFASKCSGYLVIENDFTGYGYPDLDAAVTTLVSHEMFHAIQAAYDGSEGVWWSEGTAVWAQRAYDPDNDDFLHLCEFYLDDPGRTLDRPPTGPVPLWAYGTALWWWFIADRHGYGVIADLLEASEASDGIVGDLEPVLAAAGGDLDDDWSDFATLNAMTGAAAQEGDGYPFANQIGPPDTETAAAAGEHRYYPLATTYFVWTHLGGPAAFALDAEVPDTSFALLAEEDGRRSPPIDAWTGADLHVDLGDLPEGRYWIVAARTSPGADSARVLTCVGVPANAEACAPGEEELEGCGCANVGPSPGVTALLASLGALALARRRRRE